jgi:hypothetical protein
MNGCVDSPSTVAVSPRQRVATGSTVSGTFLRISIPSLLPFYLPYSQVEPLPGAHRTYRYLKSNHLELTNQLAPWDLYDAIDSGV